MINPGPVAVNWRGQAAGAVLAGMSVSALWELIETDATGYDWDRFLIRAVLLAALVLANFAVHLRLTGRRGKFIVVVRGYDRDRVDNYRRQLAAARQQGRHDPAPPDFPIALRGYEPTQVDDWLAGVARRT